MNDGGYRKSNWVLKAPKATLRYLEGDFIYTEILEFLRVRHGYVTSLSTLKRWFREKGMTKRPLEAIRDGTSDIFEAIGNELSGSGADIQKNSSVIEVKSVYL